MTFELLVLAGPVVFVPAFVVGYGDRAPRAWRLPCGLALVAAAALGLFVPSPAVRVWTGINLLLAVFCALCVTERRNSYSGYGAIVVFPTAAVCASSLLGCAIYANT